MTLRNGCCMVLSIAACMLQSNRIRRRLVSCFFSCFEPIQPQRIASRLKQTFIHLLLIPQKSHQNAKCFKIHKTCIHTNAETNKQNQKTKKRKHQTHIFEEIVNQISPLFKKKKEKKKKRRRRRRSRRRREKAHIWLGHAGIVDPSI